MRTTSILTAAAIALAATIGSASAADQFTTLAGFEAQAMTKQEMGDVRGSEGTLTITITPNSVFGPRLIVTVVSVRSIINMSLGIDTAGSALAFHAVAALLNSSSD